MCVYILCFLSSLIKNFEEFKQDIEKANSLYIFFFEKTKKRKM